MTETLGAHIRNALTPYQNLVCLIASMKNAEELGSIELVEKFKRILYGSMDNIQHLIDISRMPEVEAIDWRNTELGKQYLKKLEEYENNV